MEEAAQRIGFAFTIGLARTENGVLYFEPSMINRGVPDEIVITMLRTWLRDAEKKYSVDFKNSFF